MMKIGSIVMVQAKERKRYGKIIEFYGKWVLVQMANHKESFWNEDVSEVNSND